MRVLVTGGCGFIGSAFVKYHLERHADDHVTNFDALTYAANIDNVSTVSGLSNYDFVKGDITDPGVVEAVLSRGIDVIVNFAAESHVDRSVLNPASFVRTNVMGTQALLDGARKYGVKKFVQISTDEVYGTLGPEDEAFSETTPLQPNSPYSASKASADLLVRAYHETYGLPINITRCSNNYGPYQFPEKLIPLMLINALEGTPLPVYGDGMQVRDWLHVWDHCVAIDLVIREGRDGEVYNVGGSNERANIDTVRTILRVLGKPESLIKHVTDRPGHDRRYAINATKIHTELGWSPRYSFESGIEETVQWYVDNQNWWSAVRSGEYLEFYGRQYGHRLGTTT